MLILVRIKVRDNERVRVDENDVIFRTIPYPLMEFISVLLFDGYYS